MIITQTPFRMSFFGGGTDMESFFKEYGGAVLSTTFDKYCYVNVRHLPRFFDYSTELSYSKTERVTDINDIQHPAIRNAMKMLDMAQFIFSLLINEMCDMLIVTEYRCLQPLPNFEHWIKNGFGILRIKVRQKISSHS